MRRALTPFGSPSSSSSSPAYSSSSSFKSAIIVLRGGNKINLNRLPRYHSHRFPRLLHLQARWECPGGGSHLRLVAWWWPCSILNLSCLFDNQRNRLRLRLSHLPNSTPWRASTSALSNVRVMNPNSNIQRINVIVLVCMVCMSIVPYILFQLEERIQKKIAEI